MSNDLPSRLDDHLKKLRAADNQSQAIAWMTAAYRLMEEAIDELRQRPVTSTIERLVFVPGKTVEKLVFVPAKPTIEVAQVLPDVRRPFDTNQRPVWAQGETVVYPEVPMPISRPLSVPKAWTHKDTLRLEKKIQKRGR